MSKFAKNKHIFYYSEKNFLNKTGYSEPLQWFSVNVLRLTQVFWTVYVWIRSIFYPGKVSKAQTGGVEHKDWEERETENENTG